MTRTAAFILLLALFFVSGCASSIPPTSYLTHQGVTFSDAPPDEDVHVLWTDRTVSMSSYKNLVVGKFTVDKAVGAGPGINKAEFAESLRQMLVADLEKHKKNAVTDEKTVTGKGPYLLIQGNIAQLNPGKRQLRRWIGFGAGRTVVDVEVKISLVTSVSKALCSEFTVSRTKAMALGGGTDAGFLNDCLAHISARSARFLARHRNR